MPRPPTRRTLLAGATVAAGLILAAIATLFFARVGVLHGNKFDLYVAAPGVMGVAKGTDVWYSGQKIGVVQGVSLRPPATNVDYRALIHLRVLTSARQTVRVNSRVSLQSGGTLIGATVVYISGGTLQSRAVASGDTLRLAPGLDFSKAAAEAHTAIDAVPDIMAGVDSIRADMAGTRAAVSLTMNEAKRTGSGTLATSLASLASRARGGLGVVPRARTDPDSVKVRAERVMRFTDLLRMRVGARGDSFATLARDTDLMAAVHRVSVQVAHTESTLANAHGSLGMFRSAAPSPASNSLRAQLAALMADIKAHPFRYLRAL